MNEVRTEHYSDFAKIGLEKEKARVENQGQGESGKSVYSKIDAEVKQLRERLKQAGVNRTVAGINAEEEYDSEEENDQEQAEKKLASPEKDDTRNTDLTAVLD